MTMVNERTAPIQERTAEITRVFKAPLRLVWEAWTRQELMARWFSPRAVEISRCEVDFRPGGRFVIGYKMPDGPEFPPAVSTFTEIVPKERIAWTGAFPGSAVDDQIRTVVTFEDLGEQTRVQVRQTLLVNPELEQAGEGMQQGWEETLERLGEFLVFPHTLTILSDTEVVITRTFAAPAQLVFEAWTKVEYRRQWYGFRTWSMPVCEIDLRPGGAYRWTLRSPECDFDACFKGEFREIVPPTRLVYTEQFLLGDQWTDPLLNTVTLDERDGHTLMTVELVYTCKEHRDGHLGSGLESGMAESHRRLDEFLATLV